MSTTFFLLPLRLIALVALTWTAALGQTKPKAPVWGETAPEVTPSGAPAIPTPSASDEHHAFMVMGNSVADSLELSELNWTPAEFEAFLAGIRARYRGQVMPVDEKAMAVIAVQQKQIGEIKRRRGSKDVHADFDELRRSLKMDSLPSGLGYRIVAGGMGARPRPQDSVVVNLTGRKLQDGEEIMSLQLPGLKTKVSDLMPGLAEGVQLLKVGGSAMYLVPGDLSYGGGKWPEDVPPGSPIVVAVQLVEIIPAQ